MQIQLKQAEIVDALKQYITKQGFNLAGKTVDISFTAGRKETGLTADVSIEETDFPRISEEDIRPVLSLVTPEIPVAEVTKEAPVTPAAEASETTGQPAQESKSLFGN